MSTTQPRKLLNKIYEWLPENNRFERIWILAKFDFQSRYYYHKLGVLWALIKPVFEFSIYYIVFTLIFVSNVPNFALYLFLGLVIWYFFSEGTSKSIFILRSKLYLIENISFNKTDLFISSTFSALLGFMFNFSAYLVMSMLLFAPPFYWVALIYFPILLFLLCLLIYSSSLILSVLSIYFKDIQHLWDMIILGGFWVTPILYPHEKLAEHIPVLIYINPMSGLIINIRNVLLYGINPDFTLLGVNFFTIVGLFLAGTFFFNKFSYKAAEKI